MGWAFVAACALIGAAAPLLAVPRASADLGGPDGYGYTWTDNRQPNPGVTFNWIANGVLLGTELTLLDDGCTINRTSLGFNFGFYGAAYSAAYLCANGFIAFSVPGSLVEYATNYASALGMDLDPTVAGGGKVYAWADTGSSPRRFVLTWDRVYTYGTANPQTFQIVLTENPTGDGTILFQYRILTSVGYHVTGIENRTGAPNLFYEGPLENGLAVLFLPPVGPRPPDVLTVEAQSVAPAAVEVGQTRTPMLALNLTTTGAVEVTDVRSDLTGAFPFPTDVPIAELWLDADRNRAFDPSADTRLAISGVGGTPVRADFILSPALAVTASLPRVLFVSYDIAPTARPGDWVGAALRDTSYIQVAFPDTVTGANLPVDTYVPTVRTEIRSGIDTLTMQWSPLNPPSAGRWASDVPFLALDLRVSDYATTVDAVTVRLHGLPPRPEDVRLLKAFLDANGDREPLGDALLASGTFGADQNATLSLGLTVSVASPRSVLLALDISGTAVLNDTVGLEISNGSSFLLRGTGDRVSGANFPAATNTTLLVDGARPQLEALWATTSPNPDGRWTQLEYFPSPRNSASLAAVGGNGVSGVVVVENDDRFLYVVIDAIGDTVGSGGDAASIAFDPEADDAATNQSDDQFTVGPGLLRSHLVYNASQGQWIEEDPCDPFWDPSHTDLACERGFDASDLDATAHRVYEFRIPLALLNVTAPIPPNATLGFAVASARIPGVVNAPPIPGNATWPFLFPGPPAPAEFARLVLAASPPPNDRPVLNWTGEPGFVGDGVDPDAGTERELYTFRVDYSDRDNDLPAIGHPKLYLWDGVVPVPGSPFILVETDPSDGDVRDGKRYTLSLTLACPGAYRHRFVAGDARGAVNATPTTSGPAVICAPRPPVLTNPSVTPTVGEVGLTVFHYNVTYQDPEGVAPAWALFVLVNKSGASRLALPLQFVDWVGQVGNYSEGARYSANTTLPEKGNDYTFAFNASDGGLTRHTPSIAGPTVLAETGGVLSLAFFDEAPLMANQGATGIRMWTAVLSAAGGSVTVTDLMMDRTGDPVDADVALVRLWHDRDWTRSVSAGDALLGSATVSNSRAMITGFLLFVDEGASVSLLAVVDVGTAAVPDDRLGLRVLDRTYVAVESPSLVEPFPAFQTTQATVNAPPAAGNVLVEGYAPGTPGISHLTVFTPTFSWAFSDPNSGDLLQRGYNASVFASATGALVWYRNETSAGGSTTYDGAALVRGRQYTFSIRLSDGRMWGAGTQAAFRLNSLPSGPVPVSPGGIGVVPGVLRLVWSPATDLDVDRFDYRWFLSETSDFSAGVVSGNTTDLEAVATAGPRTTYYWRVRAWDGYEEGPFGPVASFTTVATHGSIRGRVVSSTSPLAGASVALYDGNGSLQSQGTTGALGAFLFVDVPVGTYSLRVVAAGYREEAVDPVTVSPGTPDVDLGDIHLEAIPTPPGLGEVVLSYLPYAALVAAILAFTIILGSRLRRRKEPEEPLLSDDWLEPQGVQGAKPPTEPPESEEALFECPECGTRVPLSAEACPKCGVEFEADESTESRPGA